MSLAKASSWWMGQNRSHIGVADDGLLDVGIGKVLINNFFGAVWL